MHPNLRPNAEQNPFRSDADWLQWLLALATRLVARSLNMPEPLLHHTGVFVYVRVQEVETSIGKKSVRSGCGGGFGLYSGSIRRRTRSFR
jgi:hypothetical protein